MQKLNADHWWQRSLIRPKKTPTNRCWNNKELYDDQRHGGHCEIGDVFCGWPMTNLMGRQLTGRYPPPVTAAPKKSHETKKE